MTFAPYNEIWKAGFPWEGTQVTRLEEIRKRTGNQKAGRTGCHTGYPGRPSARWKTDDTILQLHYVCTVFNMSNTLEDIYLMRRESNEEETGIYLVMA